MVAPSSESVVIYYGLPVKQGFVHRLDGYGIREAYQMWMRFLQTCAVAEPLTAFFRAPGASVLTPEPHLRTAIDAAFPLDAPRERLVPLDAHPVPRDRIVEAVDLLAGLNPRMFDKWGNNNAELTVRADFTPRGPDGRVWPGHDPEAFGYFLTDGGFDLGRSSSFLLLGARPGMSLYLSFPGATDAELESLIPWLQQNLAFTLRPDRWSRWTLTKNGSSYRGRRLFR